ncbi:endonuclease/exonuclease/phosphatase family protein [Porphyromonas sp.]|uniref:endonuclease/exonuclease/phosphatase family protein n=1 Tax=Porphyromonas sp. TaxID=1924944 RepID=UPI0026DBC4CB|nr:endonuclease/exonuclease/phosphatase family protein [Porphyromonas sp.]MDO4770804.1 hypothetical protein [Porphyromonas sp.]
MKAHRVLYHIRRLCVLLFLSVLGTTRLTAQDSIPTTDTIMSRIVMYNVENLFDTYDDPQTDDKDFLPDGVMHWDKAKYYDKLSRIAQVISDMGQWRYPGIVGLCEVENAQVIKDLLHRRELSKAAYHYAITEGGDPRGIDVALLWDPRVYRNIRLREVPAYPLEDNRLWTNYHEKLPLHGGRHALWATFRHIATKEVIEVLVVHSPSRRQGTRSTAKQRSMVMSRIRRIIDEIQSTSPDRHIILMGDFNDNPTDRSITLALQAKTPLRSDSIDPLSIYNMSAPTYMTRHGSHRHKGRAWLPDQIIVSGSLLIRRAGGLRLTQQATRVFDPEYLRQKNGNPKRSFRGNHYAYGYSDHFPVYIDIRY